MMVDKSNWEKVKFGDVCTLVNENTQNAKSDGFEYLIGLEHIEPNNLHIHLWDTTDKETTFTRIFRKGQVLFGRRRAYQRKVAYAEFHGVCSGDILVFQAKEQLLLPELLPFIVQSDGFFHCAVDTSAGSLSPRTRFNDLANYEFLLPPKKEQARLAELLWAADEVVEREKEVKERLHTVRLLFFENHINCSASNSRLGDCLIVKKKKSKTPHSIERYIGLEHIDSGAFHTKKYNNTVSILADSYIFNKNDLLYSKLRPYLDKAIITDFEGICTTELIVYDVNNKSSKEYILNIFHSKAFLDYIVDKSFGTKMPRVSHELVADFSFFLPSLETQENILNRLRKITNLINLVKKQIELSQQLKSVLINKIF